MSLEIIEIIEDDREHAGLLDRALRKARYRTNVSHDGLTGLNDINRLKPALVLLDVMLSGIDGYEVCRRLRNDPATRHLPIILVTALTSEEHRVAGLEYGADDYIPKPFSPREVVSRVQAVLRRAGPLPCQNEGYLDGQLVLIEHYHLVEWRKKRLDLSRAEWTVLRRLARDPGQVATREELVNAVWGNDGLVHDHELDRLIGVLKWKVNEQDTQHLVTIPGVGYLLRHPS